MKTKKSSSRRHSHSSSTSKRVSTLPIGMQPTREVKSSEAKWGNKSNNSYSPQETGQPDQDLVADIRNPRGVQSGRGPLNQEGEGERQNSELAELEQIEPKL